MKESDIDIFFYCCHYFSRKHVSLHHNQELRTVIRYDLTKLESLEMRRIT